MGSSDGGCSEAKLRDGRFRDGIAKGRRVYAATICEIAAAEDIFCDRVWSDAYSGDSSLREVDISLHLK